MSERFVANEVGARAFTVVDIDRGALVCTRDTAVSAHRVASALTRVLVESEDLRFYDKVVDSLSPTEMRTVAIYLGMVLRTYEREEASAV